MESLRKETAGFSHAMKNDDSIDRKIAAWCEGKLTVVVKDKKDNDRKILQIEDKVHDNILEEYQQLVVGEIYWKFAMRVFGSDHEGMQTYITLRRMIRNFKVRLQSGIISWKDRVTEFNEFLEFCPWKAGNAKNVIPTSFSEQEMREILSDAITYEQRVHLGNHNHDVLMVPFDETITLLRNNEEHIRNQVQNQKNTDALMKTVGLENGNKNNGSGNGGGNKNNKKNKNGNSTKKGNGHKTKCGICDKYHLGKCRFDDRNGNDI